jgi:hypothetical protein
VTMRQMPRGLPPLFALMTVVLVMAWALLAIAIDAGGWLMRADALVIAGLTLWAWVLSLQLLIARSWNA